MANYFNFTKDQVKKVGTYSNGRIALQIIDESKCYPKEVATVTVNIPQVDLKEDEVLIKDWSENEGVLDDLIKFNIISKPISTVPTGFVVAHKCKLLI
jgi:hypothetical protein